MSKFWGIDFDSTINDLNRHICNTIKIIHNDDTQVEDISSWNFWNDHPLHDVVWGKSMYHSKKWTLSIPERAGAFGSMRMLKDRGDDMVVITDRRQEEFDVVRAWLDQYGFESVPLIVTDKKISKTAIAEQEGVTSVIDDSPHWIDMYSQSTSLQDIYVMSYQYNRDVPNDGRIKRIHGWADFIEKEFS